MRPTGRTVFWTAFALCSLGAWLFIQTEGIVVEKRAFSDGDLARVCASARVIQLSDLHVERYGFREKKLVSLVGLIDPDIIFITGDLVSDKRGVPACLSLVERISAGRTVIAVFGNNDHPNPDTGNPAVKAVRGLYAKLAPYDVRLVIERVLPFLRPPRRPAGKSDPNGVDPARFAAELRRRRVIVLLNQSVELTVDGREMYVAGIDDNFLMYDDVFAATANIPAGAPAILLAHSPHIVDKADMRDISLVLSGHTHGGQIVIPGFGPLYLNHSSRSSKKFVSGYYPRDKVYVNRGIGTVLLPLRIFSRPEITIFNFSE